MNQQFHNKSNELVAEIHVNLDEIDYFLRDFGLSEANLTDIEDNLISIKKRLSVILEHVNEYDSYIQELHDEERDEDFAAMEDK